MFKICFLAICLAYFSIVAQSGKLQTSNSYLISVILSNNGPEYEYCGTLSTLFGSSDFGEVKYPTGKLLPGAKIESNVMFAKQFIDFDPEQIKEVNVTWSSERYMAFSFSCKPDNVTNEGKSINVVGVEMSSRGMFKGVREGTNDFTPVKHGESVLFKL